MTRRKVLKITDSLLLQMLGPDPKHYEVIKDALPDDVKIVNFSMEGAWIHGRGTAVFLLESESYEPNRDGEPYPEIDMTLRTIPPA